MILKVLNLIRKYDFASLSSFIAGTHMDFEVIKKTLEYEQEVDLEKFKSIFNKFHNDTGKVGYSKYLDLPCHLSRSIYNAKRLGLFQSKKLKVLDIGTGAGYFPFTLRHIGHEAFAIDMDSTQMYNEMRDLLSVTWTPYEIKPLQKIEGINKRFDLITSFQILYDRSNAEGFWTEREWAYFIDNIKSNLLEESGKIFLQLNSFSPTQTLQVQKNIEFFRSIGAKFYSDHEVLI